jgi:hypothetical protein
VRRPIQSPPIHPGEILREDVLPALRLSVTDAAKRWVRRHVRPAATLVASSLAFDSRLLSQQRDGPSRFRPVAPVVLPAPNPVSSHFYETASLCRAHCVPGGDVPCWSGVAAAGCAGAQGHSRTRVLAVSPCLSPRPAG